MADTSSPEKTEQPAKKTSGASRKPVRTLPLVPLVISSVLLVAAVGIGLVALLGPLWGPLALAGAVLLVAAGWLVVKRGVRLPGLRRSGRTGGSGGGLWPGRSTRRAGAKGGAGTGAGRRWGPSGGRSGGSGRSGGRLAGLRSRMPRALGGTKTRTGTSAAGGRGRRFPWPGSKRNRGTGAAGTGGRGRPGGAATGTSGGRGGGLRNPFRGRRSGTSGSPGGTGGSPGRRTGGKPTPTKLASAASPTRTGKTRNPLSKAIGAVRQYRDTKVPTRGGKWTTSTREARRADKPTPKPTDKPTGKPAPRPEPPKAKNPPSAGPTPKTQPAASRPTPTPRGGTTMASRRGAHAEDRSLYGFGEGLKHVPNTIGEFAAQLDALANAAEGEQPLDGSLTERIRQAAASIRRVAADSGDWHGQFRRQHEADIHRVENPRKGSTHIEERADVRRARNDT